MATITNNSPVKVEDLKMPRWPLISTLLWVTWAMGFGAWYMFKTGTQAATGTEIDWFYPTLTAVFWAVALLQVWLNYSTVYLRTKTTTLRFYLDRLGRFN